MVFYSRDLVAIIGCSERTFYRRMKAHKITRTGNLLSLADALRIADALGFKKEFEQFLKDQPKI